MLIHINFSQSLFQADPFDPNSISKLLNINKDQSNRNKPVLCALVESKISESNAEPEPLEPQLQPQLLSHTEPQEKPSDERSHVSADEKQSFPIRSLPLIDSDHKDTASSKPFANAEDKSIDLADDLDEDYPMESSAQSDSFAASDDKRDADDDQRVSGAVRQMKDDFGDTQSSDRSRRIVIGQSSTAPDAPETVDEDDEKDEGKEDSETMRPGSVRITRLGGASSSRPSEGWDAGTGNTGTRVHPRYSNTRPEESNQYDDFLDEKSSDGVEEDFESEDAEEPLSSSHRSNQEEEPDYIATHRKEAFTMSVDEDGGHGKGQSNNVEDSRDLDIEEEDFDDYSQDDDDNDSGQEGKSPRDAHEHKQSKDSMETRSFFTKRDDAGMKAAAEPAEEKDASAEYDGDFADDFELDNDSDGGNDVRGAVDSGAKAVPSEGDVEVDDLEDISDEISVASEEDDSQQFNIEGGAESDGTSFSMSVHSQAEVDDRKKSSTAPPRQTTEHKEESPAELGETLDFSMSEQELSGSEKEEDVINYTDYVANALPPRQSW